MVKQVMYCVTAIFSLFDKTNPVIATALGQRGSKLALITGPLGCELHIRNVTYNIVATFVGHFPETLEIAADVRNRRTAKHEAESPEFRVVM